jgi:hypothetical protein
MYLFTSAVGRFCVLLDWRERWSKLAGKPNRIAPPETTSGPGKSAKPCERMQTAYSRRRDISDAGLGGSAPPVANFSHALCADQN